MSKLDLQQIDHKSLREITDDQALWLHKKLHQASSLDREKLIQHHLLTVQELIKRGLDHDSSDTFDHETAEYAEKSLGLEQAELVKLQLLKQATTIQSLILSKKVFKSLAAAKKWVKDNDFKVTFEGKAPDETSTSYRFRQKDPKDFKEGSFRTITLPGTKGVQAVIGKPKKKAKKKILKICAGECSNCSLCSHIPDEDEEKLVRLCPVDKADEDKQIVFGIVAEPKETDTQGDTIKRIAVIEKAAHNWLAKYQDRGVMHRKIVNSKIEIFESYVTRVAMKVGREDVKKGSWLLMYHITDDGLWKDVKAGKFTGFSLGGFARRTKV